MGGGQYGSASSSEAWDKCDDPFSLPCEWLLDEIVVQDVVEL